MAKEPEHTDVKIEKYHTTLKVQLTPEQVADRADQCAAKVADRDRKEAEQKAASKHAKSIVESIDSEIRLLSSEIRNRSTYSAVPCERRHLFREGLLKEVRLDTGEVILERGLTDGERQQELLFPKARTQAGSDETE